MNLKLKDLDISTGGVFIALLNKEDAIKMDLHVGDRISISKNKSKKSITCILDITYSKRVLMPGRIGLFNEVIQELKLRDKDRVELKNAQKPVSIQYIKKKLEGEPLLDNEINEIVKDIVFDDITDVELTYFISACYIRGMSMEEVVSMTEAVLRNGEILKLDKYPIVDKHCTGGVAGNRTTMLVVPIIAAAGLTMPKTSSRSITSPAGTADTMEVLAKVSFTLNKMKQIVDKTGCCMVWGGAMDLAPADDKIIQVEHPLSIDPTGQLIASIMAKKKSVGCTHLLIDIPVGPGTKIESTLEANKLKNKFKSISKLLGIKAQVMITDGSQPIANGIGPALEARDVLYVLRNEELAPKDLKEKAVELAGQILELVNHEKKGFGRKRALELLDSGQAYKKFKQILQAQGGKPNIKPEEIKLGKYKYDIQASNKGVIRHIDNKTISKIARVAGAPKDQSAGIYLYAHVSNQVNEKDIIYTIYSDSKEKLEFARDLTKIDNGFIIR